jgi:hypothetical protein
MPAHRTPLQPEEMAVLNRRVCGRELRAALSKRLALGLLMTFFAIVAGWMLLPPEAGTDQATVDWYTQ